MGSPLAAQTLLPWLVNESKIESIFQSIVQSMVQSRVQSPAFALTPFCCNICHFAAVYALKPPYYNTCADLKGGVEHDLCSRRNFRPLEPDFIILQSCTPLLSPHHQFRMVAMHLLSLICGSCIIATSCIIALLAWNPTSYVYPCTNL